MSASTARPAPQLTDSKGMNEEKKTTMSLGVYIWQFSSFPK